MGEKVRVAAIQATPVFMNLDATIEKACTLIEKAGSDGARLVVLPEAFVPGYPVWVSISAPGERQSNLRYLYAELLHNAVSVDSQAVRELGKAARAAGAFVVAGVSEKNSEASGTSLYNSLLYIDDKGELIGCHRKLVPTNAERLVWTPGDGASIEALDTGIGRLGGLICWENYMPLARFSLYASGAEIYVAPTWSDSQTWLATLQHIAFEGHCFVIGCSNVMRSTDIPDRFQFKQYFVDAEREWIRAGNTAIFDPEGALLAGPLRGEEGVVSADIDVDSIAAARASFDVAGHYARPDVFQLTVNRSPRPMIRTIRDDDA
jgi:nitrilase